MRRVGKCGIDSGLVTKFPVITKISGCFLMYLRSTGSKRLADIGDRGQDIIVNLDHFRGVLCLLQGFRNDKCHLIPDMSHGIDGHTVVGRCLMGRSVLAGNSPAADQPADPVGDHIRAGKDIDDTRRRFGRAQVDIVDFCKCMRGAQEISICLACPVHIIEVMTIPRDKPLVFFTPD